MFEKYLYKKCDVLIMFGRFPQVDYIAPLTISGELISYDDEFICIKGYDSRFKKDRESLISIKNILAFHSYE